MNVKKAFDIIENDPDYLDIKKWKRKHYKAQEVYYMTEGLTKAQRKMILKAIKQTQKKLLLEDK